MTPGLPSALGRLHLSLLLIGTLALASPVSIGATLAVEKVDESQPVDGGWPRLYNLPEGASALLYQPQIAEWKDQRHLVAWSAVSYQANKNSKPQLGTIKDNNLKFAVNTNWDVFQSPEKTVFLRDNKNWLTSTAIDSGWTPARELPASLRKLPADDWKEVQASLPGGRYVPNAIPSVFVSFEPAELIQIQGEPVLAPVAGTSLFWVSNTESDLFRHQATGAFYYLVAGRWFSATSLDGPWTFATPQLPKDFKKIPIEHPRSRVLASVPGTDQATEAVLLAQIPQTARVNAKEIKAPEVNYQGDRPEFQKIQTTSIELAVNTSKQVLKFEDRYYLCFQGVWFRSASATGPWSVAKSIPKEIYSIPASSPAHNVTYVVVEQDGDDDDDWVTFGAVAGYTGMMVAWVVPCGARVGGIRLTFRTAGLTLLIFGIHQLTAWQPGTTLTPERLGAVQRSMVHMAAQEVGRPTIHEREHMLVGAPPMDHTVRATLHF